MNYLVLKTLSQVTHHLTVLVMMIILYLFFYDKIILLYKCMYIAG